MVKSLIKTSKITEDALFELRNSYLDLMQASLTGSLFRDSPQALFGSKNYDPHIREHGLDWPANALTMIGTKRASNLRALAESVIADKVPGDFIETGVWRGGACILMRAILLAYGITNRKVWVADSFEGLPEANEHAYPADSGSDFHTYEQLAVPLEQAKKNFKDYGMLDEQVKFLKGWFKDTLPSMNTERFALIRLDGDMYESTMDALSNLYPKLSYMGYVIIDDYYVVPACKKAVHDYCNANNIEPEVFEIDGVGVYWRKIAPSAPKVTNFEGDQNSSTLSTKELIVSLNEAVYSLSKRAIASLSQALVEHDTDGIKLNQALAERDSEVRKLNQILANRDTDIDLLNQELVALYSSTSWKVTKPLRFMKKSLIRIGVKWQANHH